MKTPHISRSLAITFVGQIITYGQGLIVMPIAIKLAGETTYGAYVLIISMLTAAFGLSGLGTGFSYRRYLASTTDFVRRRQLFEPQFTFQTLNLGIISLAFLIGGAEFQRLIFGPTIHIKTWIVPVWLLVYLLFSQVADYFRYSMRFIHFNLIGIYPTLFVLFVAIYAAVTRTITLDVLLMLQIAAYAMVAAPLVYTLLREVGFVRPRLPLKALAGDISAGYPLTLQYLTDLILGYGDRYLIVFFLTIADVGRYQPAYQVAALAIFFPRVAGVILPPVLSHLVDSGAESAARALVNNFIRLFLMLAVPFVVGAAIVGPTLIALLAKPDVAEASRWVFPLIATATIFNGIAQVAFQVAFVMQRTKTVLNANVFAMLLNMTLNFILLSMFRNITIPAAVSLLSYICCFAYVRWALKDIWPINIERKPLILFIIAATGMAAFLFAVGFLPGTISQVRLPVLLLDIFLSVAIYFAMLAVVGGFGRTEIRQLRSIFHHELQVTEDVPESHDRLLP